MSFKLIPAAADAYDDIELFPLAERTGLPRSAFTLPQPLIVSATLFGVSITYRLYPNCIGTFGSPQCIFYAAYNVRADRTEFAVGPRMVDDFDRHAALYATAAGNFFGLTGYNNGYQIGSALTVHHALRGNIVAAAESLGDGWVEALQDPSWWVQVIGGYVAAEAPKPLASSCAARVTNPARFPAVARALRTQANLQGLEITRSVQLLEQPTIFRHSITADVKPVSFARIEAEGSLRFSSDSNAHYGEGVYAWQAGKTGIGGRYIDIEVPAGSAAELIRTPAGSWYRLVPANGDVLPVRVVGHNFAPSEVALGRAVLSGE